MLHVTRSCRRRIPYAAVALLFLLTPVLPAHGETARETQSRLSSQLQYLASDALEGRGVGTEGLNQAAEFIRDQFQAAGLDVSPESGGGFQTFSMVIGAELGTPNALAFAGEDGRSLELKPGKDFQTCSFGGSGNVSGELVFCGYGIDAPKDEYSDFADVDVKGRVVIIMRRVPQQGNPHGPFAGVHGRMSRHAELRTKVSAATSAGAAAILFVNDPYTVRQEAETLRKQVEQAAEELAAAEKALAEIDPQNEEELADARQKLEAAKRRLQNRQEAAENPETDSLMEFGYGGKGSPNAVPIFHITQEKCNELLQASLGKSLEELEAAIDKDLKPRSALLNGWTVRGAATVKRVETEVKNVIGVLEGRGPFADETIIIGAHYDHVGRGGEGSLAPNSKEVHNGADDNASGTVSLIELARRFASRETSPARRLVFIAFTGEELGLIGSAHYCKEPAFPLEKTIAMFNMDMVGRLKDDRLLVYGTGTAPRWKELVETLGKEYGFDLALKPEGFGPSDHSSFYAQKIPVLHFFTDIHEDYHRPTDDWQKINFPGMLRVIGMIEEIIAATVESPKPPEYIAVKSTATLERGGSRPYFGSIPNFGSNEPGYSISGASPGSPADRAGLKAGDRIIRLGDNKITNLNDFDLALRKFSAGDEVEVVVIRDGENITLKVTLEKPR